MSAIQSKRNTKLTRWVPLTLCLVLVPTFACKRDAGPDNQTHNQTKGSRDVAAGPGRTGAPPSVEDTQSSSPGDISTSPSSIIVLVEAGETSTPADLDTRAPVNPPRADRSPAEQPSAEGSDVAAGPDRTEAPSLRP